MDDQINCQYCDELISKNAKKCKHCGEILDPQMRDIEMLKSNKNNNQQVFMNSSGSQQLRPYPWGWHLLMTFLTGGLWIPIWVLMYIFRNRGIYF